MKPTLLPTIGAALLLAVSASTAADKPAAATTGTDSTKTQVQKPAKVKKVKVKLTKEQTVTVTGSYIKQRVTKDGVIVSGMSSPLLVIDSEGIRKSGATDVADLLRRGGWAH